jgi:arsenate reductase (glutaredoxin)
MDKMIIYQKPTCSTCRKVLKLAEESGHPFTAVNYYEEPFSKSQLKDLLRQSGLSASEILRSKEDLYKTLNLGQSTKSEDELLELMIKYPDLIQRPLVKKGNTVILARPPETLKTLLSPEPS